MSVVIMIWIVSQKCQTLTFNMNSSAKLPGLCTNFISSDSVCRQVYNQLTIWANHLPKSAPGAFVTFLKARGRFSDDGGYHPRQIAYQVSQMVSSVICNKLVRVSLQDIGSKDIHLLSSIEPSLNLRCMWQSCRRGIELVRGICCQFNSISSYIV